MRVMRKYVPVLVSQPVGVQQSHPHGDIKDEGLPTALLYSNEHMCEEEM